MENPGMLKKMAPLSQFITVLVACYVLLAALVYLYQRRLIYLPDRSRPDASMIHSLNIEFWMDNGSDYQGFVVADVPDKPKGTVIVFHGNAGAAWHRDYYVHALVPIGFNVILAEYPGYGGRPGQPSENVLVKDAMRTIKLAHEQFGSPIYLLGESLGCGVVAAVASNTPAPIKGIVLITPWDSLTELAKSVYWYLPVGLLLHDRFDSIKNLQGFEKPVAVAIADHDEVIPTSNSLHLYESLKGPKRLWRFENAGHNNWPSSPREQWWRQVMQFVSM